MHVGLDLLIQWEEDLDKESQGFESLCTVSLWWRGSHVAGILALVAWHSSCIVEERSYSLDFTALCLRDGEMIVQAIIQNEYE